MAVDNILLCLDEWLVEKDNDSLRCTICWHVLYQPVNLSTCSHTFCLHCLQAHVKEHSAPTCPQCRTPLSATIHSVLSSTDCSLVINGSCNFQLAKLKVSCPHCGEWKDSLGTNRANVIAHHNVCPQLPVCCSLGCGQLIARDQLGDHEDEECPRRLVWCEHCDEQFTHEALAAHVINKTECADCHLCKLGCGVPVVDKYAADHITNYCSHRLVLCPVCNKRFKQRHLEQYVQSNLVDHLMSLAGQITTLTTDNAALRRRVELLEASPPRKRVKLDGQRDG